MKEQKYKIYFTSDLQISQTFNTEARNKKEAIEKFREHYPSNKILRIYKKNEYGYDIEMR